MTEINRTGDKNALGIPGMWKVWFISLIINLHGS